LGFLITCNLLRKKFVLFEIYQIFSSSAGIRWCLGCSIR